MFCINKYIKHILPLFTTRVEYVETYEQVDAYYANMYGLLL